MYENVAGYAVRFKRGYKSVDCTPWVVVYIP